MENKKNKKMTLDSLAGMVSRGFEKTATRDDLKELKAELKGDIHVLDKKVDKLDFQVDEVKDILERLEESDILNLQKRVQILEKAVRSLATGQSPK